jgi:quercetin dioxygenase-like cupin family protein
MQNAANAAPAMFPSTHQEAIMRKSGILSTIAVGLTLVAAGYGGNAAAQDWAAVSKSAKLKFENEAVRVFEVTLRPGDMEPVHTHPANLAYIMNSGKVRVAYVGGEAQNVEVRKGDVLYSDPEGPHTLENLGKTTMRAIVVELKDRPLK